MNDILETIATWSFNSVRALLLPLIGYTRASHCACNVYCLVSPYGEHPSVKALRILLDFQDAYKKRDFVKSDKLRKEIADKFLYSVVTKKEQHEMRALPERVHAYPHQTNHITFTLKK